MLPCSAIVTVPLPLVETAAALDIELIDGSSDSAPQLRICWTDGGELTVPMPHDCTLEQLHLKFDKATRELTVSNPEEHPFPEACTSTDQDEAAQKLEPPRQLDRRHEACGPDWSEKFINSAQASACSVAEAVLTGHSVLLVPGLATDEECKALVSEATSVAAREREVDDTRLRMPLADRFECETTRRMCETLLVRALSLVEEQLPMLRIALFGDCDLTRCCDNPELDFADGSQSLFPSE